MRVSELVKILETQHPDTEVLIQKSNGQFVPINGWSPQTEYGDDGNGALPLVELKDLNANTNVKSFLAMTICEKSVVE